MNAVVVVVVVLATVDVIHSKANFVMFIILWIVCIKTYCSFFGN